MQGGVWLVETGRYSSTGSVGRRPPQRAADRDLLPAGRLLAVGRR